MSEGFHQPECPRTAAMRGLQDFDIKHLQDEISKRMTQYSDKQLAEELLRRKQQQHRHIKKDPDRPAQTGPGSSIQTAIDLDDDDNDVKVEGPMDRTYDVKDEETRIEMPRKIETEDVDMEAPHSIKDEAASNVIEVRVIDCTQVSKNATTTMRCKSITKLDSNQHLPHPVTMQHLKNTI